MITDYLDQALQQEGTRHDTKKGLQYSYNCPKCHDYKPRLFVNIDRKVVFCHNCGYSASMITFLSDINHIPWRDALFLFRNQVGYDHALPNDLEQEIYQKLYKSESIVQQRYIHPLPKEYIPIEKAKGSAGKSAIKYLRSRGVSLDDCIRYKIGYCAKGDYENRIIMPDFEDGKLVYWQARTWLPTPTNYILKGFFRKVLNPSLTKEQIQQGVLSVDKSEVISNIDFIRELGTAIICEGKFDAYVLKDFGACTHGKYMSDEQFMKLVTNKDKIKYIYVMYDGDAMKFSLSTASRLSKYFDNVYICVLPYKEDPSSLGTKKCIEIINNAVEYTPLAEIKLRLIGNHI